MLVTVRNLIEKWRWLQELAEIALFGDRGIRYSSPSPPLLPTHPICLKSTRTICDGQWIFPNPLSTRPRRSQLFRVSPRVNQCSVFFPLRKRPIDQQ